MYILRLFVAVAWRRWRVRLVSPPSHSGLWAVEPLSQPPRLPPPAPQLRFGHFIPLLLAFACEKAQDFGSLSLLAFFFVLLSATCSPLHRLVRLMCRCLMLGPTAASLGLSVVSPITYTLPGFFAHQPSFPFRFYSDHSPNRFLRLCTFSIWDLLGHHAVVRSIKNRRMPTRRHGLAWPYNSYQA